MDKELDPQLRRQIEFSHYALETVLEAAEKIHYDTEKPGHVHALALYGTICELFSGCTVLAESGRTTGIPILTRSIFEALVDLDNLLQNYDYYKNIEAANYEDMIKLLDQVQVNPMLKGFGEPEKVAQTLDEFRTRLADLLEAGFRPQKVFERSRQVNRENQYRSHYALLCWDTHNNLAALSDRHLTGDGDSVKVNIFAIPNDEMTRQRLIWATGHLIESAIMIDQAFKIGASSIAELAKRYDRERAASV